MKVLLMGDSPLLIADDMGKRLTINDPLGTEECHPDNFCYFCKNLHGSCECRCHEDKPQEVIEAIFGKTSAQVTGTLSG